MCNLKDYLHVRMSDDEIGRLSALGLAHIGDCVFELLTRAHLVQDGTQTARKLHSRTVAEVCAHAQYEAAQRILDLLTEEETDVFHRGRNAKPKSIPKAASHAEYAYATAIECLFGWLYLSGKQDRLLEIWGKILTLGEEA